MEDEHLHLSIFFIVSVMAAFGVGSVVIRTLALHAGHSKYPVLQAAAKGVTYVYG